MTIAERSERAAVDMAREFVQTAAVAQSFYVYPEELGISHFGVEILVQYIPVDRLEEMRRATEQEVSDTVN